MPSDNDILNIHIQFAKSFFFAHEKRLFPYNVLCHVGDA